MMDTAILLVSFGTAVKETRKKTLDAIESEIRSAFPSALLSHAWTSRILREKVRQQEGLIIPALSEALTALNNRGVRSLIVLPTFVADGAEYRQMVQEVQTYSHLFDAVQIAAPLLGENPESLSHRNDILPWEEQIARPIISSLLEELPSCPEDELLVFMGHGTSNDNDLHYVQLNNSFHALGYTNVFVKTMKSAAAMDEILEIAKRRKIRKITLAPFMIVAGGHSLKDMSGDNETSWKSRLEAEGFFVHCLIKGLGEYRGIRKIFISRIGQTVSF